MAKKAGTSTTKPDRPKDAKAATPPTPMSPVHPGRPSSLLDTRVVYCGDNLEQLAKLPDACVDLIYIDPPFNSNGNYEVFWGETEESCRVCWYPSGPFPDPTAFLRLNQWSAGYCGPYKTGTVAGTFCLLLLFTGGQHYF